MVEPQNNQPPAQQQQQQVSLNDHINAQKGAMGNKLNEMMLLCSNVVDTWANNFIISEKVKNKRTEQVNFFLSFFNQLANEGFLPLNQLGIETKDPEVSNKILECNNQIMMIARNIVTNTQQQEESFQKELQDMMKTAVPTQPKTEVKTQEA